MLFNGNSYCPKILKNFTSKVTAGPASHMHNNVNRQMYKSECKDRNNMAIKKWIVKYLITFDVSVQTSRKENSDCYNYIDLNRINKMREKLLNR